MYQDGRDRRQTTGIIVLSDIGRVLKRRFSIAKVQVASALLASQYAEQWKPLAGQFRGKRVFLLGNGPSLNITPLHLLAGEYTLCFNRFSLFWERLAWTPSMYMVVDGLVAEDMADELNDAAATASLAFFTRYSLSTGLDFRRFVRDRTNILWMLPKALRSEFDFALPRVNVGGSVAVAGLQVLKYLGFSEIVLVGIDMNYKVHENVDVLGGNDIQAKTDDDPNHFDPRYFGAGRKYHQPDRLVVDTIMRSFERISKQFARTDCRVVNATRGGRLESFPRVPFESLFGLSDAEAGDRFRSTFTTLTGLDFDSEVTAGMRASSERLVVVPEATATQRLGELVHSHLPVGPYAGNLYFVSRAAVTTRATSPRLNSHELSSTFR